MKDSKELAALRQKTHEDLSKYGHWSADEAGVIVDLLIGQNRIEKALREIKSDLDFIKKRIR